MNTETANKTKSAVERGETNAKTLKATCVKLTEKEFDVLQKEAVSTQRSVPTILKDAFFKNSGQSTFLFEKAAHEDLMKELNRIGVNINQIARHINSGYRFVWIDAFQNLSNSFESFYNAVKVNCGNR